MVSSYARIRCPLEEAMARYGGWIGLPEIAPRRLVPERDKIDLAVENGDWLGLAIYIYASGPWTVVEELSGGLATRPVADWLALADGGDLVYAGYNDTVPYSQLIVIEKGELVRQYLRDEQDPSEDVDVGRLPEEATKPFKDWISVMSWVEEDEDKLDRSEKGWLWIHQAP